MPRRDAVFLVALLAFSGLGFALPALRTESWAGVSLFGWWMAALMVLAPAVALLRVLRR